MSCEDHLGCRKLKVVRSLTVVLFGLVVERLGAGLILFRRWWICWSESESEVWVRLTPASFAFSGSTMLVSSGGQMVGVFSGSVKADSSSVGSAWVEGAGWVSVAVSVCSGWFFVSVEGVVSAVFSAVYLFRVVEP